MREERYANNFQVRFGHGKSRVFDLESVYIIQIFDVIVDDRQVGLLAYLVGDDDDASRIGADVVDKDFSFGVTKIPVNVSNMKRRVLHEGRHVVRAHRNDDMFPGRAFSGRLDSRFLLIFPINNAVYLVNFLSV